MLIYRKSSLFSRTVLHLKRCDPPQTQPYLKNRHHAYMKTKNTQLGRIAILNAIDSSTDGWYQLLPAGSFTARDGRPTDTKNHAWYIDANIAKQFIANTIAQNQPIQVDYNHASLSSEPHAAIAAGWIRNPEQDIEWRESGLYVRISWTPSAQTAIQNREWAYLSAVFPYDENGHPIYLRMVAVTNDPGITGMQSLAALSAADHSQKEDTTMNELLKQLLAALGIDASEVEEVSDEMLQQAIEAVATLTAVAEVATDVAQIVDENTDSEVIGGDVEQVIEGATEEISEVETILEEAALSGMDLRNVVPARAYRILAARMAALSAGSSHYAIENALQTARRNGRITAAEMPYLRIIGKQYGLAQLNADIRNRSPIQAITRKQTLGKKPLARHAVLSAADKEAAKLMGISEQEMQRRKQLKAGKK